MRPRRARLAVAAVTVFSLIAVPAWAGPGTLSGKLTGGKLPSAASGRAVVRAIHVPDGITAAGAVASGAGRFRLALDAGAYVLVTSVVGKGKAVADAIAPVQRVSAGRATRTNVSLRRTRTPPRKRVRRGSARAAATLSAPVAVKNFSATGPNTQLGKGLADMLITELTQTQAGDCQPQVVEWEHRADLLKEIALSNSVHADPRTRIPAGNLIDPAIFIQGVVTTTATTTEWSLEMVEAKTGDVLGGDSGSANGTDVLDAPAGIAQRLTDQLCAEYDVKVEVNATISIPPYIGTGIVTADVPAKATPGATLPTSWSGQAPAAFNGLIYAGVPDCPVTPGAHTGYVRVEIKRAGPDLIELTWGGETNASTFLVCNGVTIPNGVPPIQPFQGTVPTTMVLPSAGGTFSLSGGLAAPGGAWINTGTVTVTRVVHGP